VKGGEPEWLPFFLCRHLGSVRCNYARARVSLLTHLDPNARLSKSSGWLLVGKVAGVTECPRAPLAGENHESPITSHNIVRMPRPITRRQSKPTRVDERVFADESGRLWSIARTARAVVFTCISDARQSGRALALEDAAREDDTGDETLRAWLGAAPKIGSLS